MKKEQQYTGQETQENNHETGKGENIEPHPCKETCGGKERVPRGKGQEGEGEGGKGEEYRNITCVQTGVHIYKQDKGFFVFIQQLLLLFTIVFKTRKVPKGSN